MKDSLSLLAAGVLLALVGWAFWHYLGTDAPSALVTVALIAVTVDNARLRRQLHKREKG